jgi:spore maturation protein CgeB
MNVVVFGLTISSTWGNGHATLWRGLCHGLGECGHRVVFFERDLAYYAEKRDGVAFPGCDLRLYADWDGALSQARRAVAAADAALVTSYCPDGRAAADLVRRECRGVRGFYDMDTPITLEAAEQGRWPPYLPEGGLSDFDLVLSFTGGRALEALRTRLGARAVAPLYGSVDPSAHLPAPPVDPFRADLSYLGTYAADRQDGVQRLFLEVAERLPDRRFVLGGALYEGAAAWPANVRYLPHVASSDHCAFFGSAGLSLNVTRAAMARWGFCPSGRLFEAAACGVAQISDDWDGLETFFAPGREILIARTTEDVLDALTVPDGDRAVIAAAARRRVLAEHTSLRRAAQLASLLRGGAATERSDSQLARTEE